MKTCTIIILFTVSCLSVFSQYSISGSTIDSITNTNLINTRVTLFNSDTTFFQEERTANNGTFQFNNVPAGNYSLGASSVDKEYFQTSLNVMGNVTMPPVKLPAERHLGIWQIIVQSPEALGGTDLGILMPDGRIFYCHNSTDPFYFNPVTNVPNSFPGDATVQGCVGPVLMPDGLLLMAGGTLQNVYGPGTRKVKSFDFLTNSWVVRSNMLDYRWYPTITKLTNNQLLICGGGNLNNPVRTKTSEIYNTSNWITQFTDTLAIGNEVSPIVVLYNGKALMTHRPPQLFNPVTLQWDSAAPFVQGPRTPNGDHSDHELVLLSNGDVIAVGYNSSSAIPGTFIERYNPSSNTWTLGSSISPVRSQAKTVLLPTEKILVMAGYKESVNDTSSTNQWGFMNLCDEYNPSTDSWRRLKRMNLRREYHCNTILVPDGRVIAVGGEGAPGNEPPFSTFEGFSPPYLFRGIRPVISNLSSTNIERGESFSFNISYTNSVTSIILYSLQAVTHFMNSGNNRFVRLPFSQTGSTVFSVLPADSLVIPDGHYMLFAMVDDIPSIAKIITVVGSNVSVLPVSVQLKVFIEGFYLDNGLMQPTVNPTVYPNLCDSVVAELHNVNSPYTLIHSSKGTISTSGNGTFNFPALSAGKSYYLVLRHRNVLETWSANPIVIFNNMRYDFTKSKN